MNPCAPSELKDDTDEGSPVGGWFQGLAKTWETHNDPARGWGKRGPETRNERRFAASTEESGREEART